MYSVKTNQGKIMGNGYNSHHQSLHLQHKTTFLPLLCSRPSIKDVALPKLEDHRSTSLSSDPLSPRIGCMGQVKRHHEMGGFPSATKITPTASTRSAPLVKYSKLKRIFSVKNNNPITVTATSAPQTTSACRGRGVMVLNGARTPKIEDNKENNNSVTVSVENMDPPLPVIKRVNKPVDGEEVDTIWKRRSGGLALKNLQLRQIQLNRHNNLAPTTV